MAPAETSEASRWGLKCRAGVEALRPSLITIDAVEGPRGSEGGTTPRSTPHYARSTDEKIVPLHVP